MTDAKPINPQRVFWELSPRLPDNCIIACDSGTSADWYARDVKLRDGHDGVAVGRARDDGLRRCRMRLPPSSRTPTGR